MVIDPAYEQKLLSRSFFHYLGPAILSLSFGQVAPLVDALCISRCLGEEALSMMSVVSPLYYAYNIIAVLFGIGIGVFLAKEAGSGRCKASGRLFTKGFLAMSVLSVIFSVAVLCFMDPVIIFLRATPENISYTREYTTVLMIGGVFYVWNIAGSYILTDDHDPNLALAGSAIACIVNVIIDIVGLYILRQGVWAAAFGTVFGMFCSSFVFVLHFRKKESVARFDFSRDEATDISIVKLIKPGIPQGVMYAAVVLRQLIMNYILVFEGGTDGLGNAAVIQNLELVVTILIAGISDTVMPIAAAYNGEKNRCGMHMVRRSAIVLGYIVLVPFFVLLVLFPNSFIRLFVEDNVHMMETLPTAVRISIGAFFFLMFAQIQQSYYSSVGEERTSMIAGFIQTVFQTLALIVLPAFTPRNAAWYSLLIGSLAAGVYVIVFKNGLEGVLRFFRGDTIYMTGAAINTSEIARNVPGSTMDAVRQKVAPFCSGDLLEKIRIETCSILSEEERRTLDRELLKPFSEGLTSCGSILASFFILDAKGERKTAILHFDLKEGRGKNKNGEKSVGETEFCMVKRRMISL